MTIVLTAINAKYIHSSLAAYSLYSYLAGKPEGERLQIKEFTINQSEDLIISELFSLKPDVLAFSCYIWNIEMIKSIVKTFKKIMPGVKIILGGPEASYEHEDLFSLGADAIVTGEGEQAFKSFIYDVLNNNPISKVYRSEKILPLEDIPFPYQDGFDDLENRILYYETSRGCVNNCGYCLSSITKGIRFLPFDRIKTDLSKFLSAKVKQVKFVDRTFNSAKGHAMAIWSFLIQNDNGVTNFHFEIAGDLLDDEMIALISQARKGLFQFEIGVQSTNEKTLKEIDRSTNTQRLFENVCKLKIPGNVNLHLDLIVGLPHENLPSFIQSFNDGITCWPDKLQVGFLKLLKGCDLRNNADKYGIQYKNNAPYEILSNNFMDFETIDKLKKIESMVEILYNSGAFKCYTRFMINQYETPYHFFERISSLWVQKGYHLASHKKITLCNILYEFGKGSTISENIISELLKFDMLLHDNIRTFPDWIGQYYQCDYKQITKTIATHAFDYDICTWLADQSQPLQKKEIKATFDYTLKTDFRVKWH